MKEEIAAVLETSANLGPPTGMPSDNMGKSAARLYQNTNCTSTGVPRKNQVKA